MEHLHPSVRDTVSLPESERIAAIEGDRWVGYTRAIEILNVLQDLFNHAKSNRVPGMLITGRTNNGKTMILKRFMREHPVQGGDGEQTATIPVVFAQCPAMPSESRLYDELLDGMGMPNLASYTVGRKRRIITDMLATFDTRMLIVDEIQHLSAAGAVKQREFLNALKLLSNQLQIPLVVSGTQEAYNAIQHDPQLENRFHPQLLPLWKPNREFMSLLASLEMLTPLAKPSSLTANEMANALYAASEGVLGELCSAVRACAKLAVQNGEERITPKLLKESGWKSPTERAKLARQLR